jgi:hypothetical protein
MNAIQSHKELFIGWLEHEKKHGLLDVKITPTVSINRLFLSYNLPAFFPSSANLTEEEMCRELCDLLTAPPLPDRELV